LTFHVVIRSGIFTSAASNEDKCDADAPDSS
jgi:hypothetical protein